MEQNENSQVVSTIAVAEETPKKRLLWALKPLCLAGVLLLWVLNPITLNQESINLKIFLGGFLGLFLGIIFCWKQIMLHSSIKIEEGVYRKNRIPAEFYWGKKEKVLFPVKSNQNINL